MAVCGRRPSVVRESREPRAVSRDLEERRQRAEIQAGSEQLAAGRRRDTAGSWQVAARRRLVPASSWRVAENERRRARSQDESRGVNDSRHSMDEVGGHQARRDLRLTR